MFGLFKKSVFGLNISDCSIEVVSLKGTIDNPRLFAMGRSILEPRIVEDGKIFNKEILKKTLSHLIGAPKFGKIKTNKFIFALPESKSFIHIFELPKDLKKKEELEFIKSQANQIFPFPIEELYLDFKINPHTKQGQPRLSGENSEASPRSGVRARKKDNSKEVLLIAAPKTVVNDYLEVFKSLKLYPLAIEIESESLGRSLIQDPKETVLIIDIGARTTNFSIFAQKELRFSYTIEVAGNNFTKALAEGLRISSTEAESIKKESGLNPEIKKGKLFFILQKEVQTIVLETKNIEKYFQKKENKNFKKIILAGGSALLPFLPEYLNKNLERPVIIADPWIKINIDILKKKEYFKKALEINPVFYTTCIGSALRGLAKNPKKVGINLLKGMK